MKNVFLFLAIIGAAAPGALFVRFFQSDGAGFQSFFAAIFANDPASAFSIDLVISSIAFWLLMAQQKTRRMWIFIALNLGIGLSCALPAWLYVSAREREALDTGAP